LAGDGQPSLASCFASRWPRLGRTMRSSCSNCARGYKKSGNGNVAGDGATSRRQAGTAFADLGRFDLVMPAIFEGRRARRQRDEAGARCRRHPPRLRGPDEFSGDPPTHRCPKARHKPCGVGRAEQVRATLAAIRSGGSAASCPPSRRKGSSRRSFATAGSRRGARSPVMAGFAAAAPVSVRERVQAARVWRTTARRPWR
jgi:hypothetical protein